MRSGASACPLTPQHFLFAFCFPFPFPWKDSKNVRGNRVLPLANSMALDRLVRFSDTEPQFPHVLQEGPGMQKALNSCSCSPPCLNNSFLSFPNYRRWGNATLSIPASFAAGVGHMTLLWPRRCQQKSIGNFLGKHLLCWTKLTPSLPVFLSP